MSQNIILLLHFQLSKNLKPLLLTGHLKTGGKLGLAGGGFGWLTPAPKRELSGSRRKGEDLLCHQKAHSPGDIVPLRNTKKKELEEIIGTKRSSLFGWQFTYILSRINLRRKVY